MRLIFTFLFSLVFVLASQGQNTIAKLKYEEAEEAFSRDDYKKTLEKLDESEKAMKMSNQKTMYLRIVAQAKLAETDFAILQSARKNANSYLGKYQNTPGIEDKYRDIYKISESLKTYPNTLEQFGSWSLEKAKADQIAQKPMLLAKKFETWDSQISGIRLGMSLSEVKAVGPSIIDYSNPIDVKKGQYGSDRDCIAYGRKNIKLKSEEGFTGLSIDKADNRVISVSHNLIVGKKNDEQMVKAKYEELLKKAKLHFGEENISETEKTTPIDKTRNVVVRTAYVHENAYGQYMLSLSTAFMGIYGNSITITEAYSKQKLNF